MKSCLVVLTIFFFGLTLILGAAAVIVFFIGRRRRVAGAGPVRPGVPVRAHVPPPQPPPPPPDDATVVAAVPVAKRHHGRIVFTFGPLSGTSADVSREGIWIGRDHSSQLVIPSSKISKRHVWVGLRDDVPVVVDNGSTNGTFLAASPSERISERTLSHGDEIILADDAARFRYEAA